MDSRVARNTTISHEIVIACIKWHFLKGENLIDEEQYALSRNLISAGQDITAAEECYIFNGTSIEEAHSAVVLAESLMK